MRRAARAHWKGEIALLHHLQTDDTRAAILIASRIQAEAAEPRQIDDPIDAAFLDIVEIYIMPTVRVAQQWYALERAGDERRQLIRDTLVIIGAAIGMYTERGLALLPSEVVTAARADYR